MLKIFFVEDDAAIRESIKRNVKWNQYGYEFIGDAADGELAYTEIKKLVPDVIITDLKMPFMDGLELSRLVRKELPATKIVVLTGLNDFESVQEALRIGVIDYLLKPVTSESLSETLVKVRGMIEEEQEYKAYQHLYRRDMAELRDLKLQKFFENWMTGSKKVYELLDIASQFAISLNASSYVVIRFQLYLDDDSEGYSDELERLYGTVDAALASNENLLVFKQGLQGWAVIVKGNEALSAATLARQTGVQLKELLDGNGTVHYVIAVGTQTVRLQDITKSYNSASRAYAYRYVAGRDAVIYADELKIQEESRGELDLQKVDVSRINSVAVEQFLRSGNADAVPMLVSDIFDSIGAQNIQSFMMRQYIIMNVTFSVSAFLDRVGVDQTSLARLLDDAGFRTSDLSTVAGTMQYLGRLLECALELRDLASNNRYDYSIEKACEYISTHFASEDISLNSVAKSVNLSPAHFSSIFSRNMGKTFTEYLTEIRMERARELLLFSTKRSSEVAYEIGFRDPHYFSYVFKKMYGCSPREFRSTGKE